MKQRIRVYTIEFIYLSVALVLAGVLAFFISAKTGVIVSGICILALAIFFLAGMLRRYRWERIALKILKDNKNYSVYLDTIVIPTALTTISGKVMWCNTAFTEVSGYGAKINISKMIKGFDVPDKDMNVNINGKAYNKEVYPVKHKRREMLLYRLVDKSSALAASEPYQNYIGVVCYMQIDNFDELTAQLSMSDLSSVIVKTEQLISQFAEELTASFLRIGRGKYMCLFERRSLPLLKQSKFLILTQVSQIQKTSSPTLSIAVGVGETQVQSSEFANRALELSLGRGGDQAVVNQDGQFEFFGGTGTKSNRRNKDKSRMISHALRNLMEQCSDVFVMGHEVPDSDCMGAALGICACARVVGKNAYIVLENPNPSIEPLLVKISKTKEYAGTILSGKEAAAKINASSMLVIVDTQNAGYIISPNLLKLCDTVVVFDHHLRGKSNIEGAALFYHEQYASSVCEIVTEVLQYFGDDLSPLPIELEGLLCGIIIDTKDFLYNTGVRTYEAASYLQRSGAQSKVIRELVQDDATLYEKRTDIVRSAEVIAGGFAIAKCPLGTQNAQLVSAQAADDLLTIRGNGASFVVSEIDGDVVISGRSIGEINVQLILESLGGGGHATMAAVKLNGTSIDEAYNKLKNAINKFMKED